MLMLLSTSSLTGLVAIFWILGDIPFLGHAWYGYGMAMAMVQQPRCKRNQD